MFLDTSGFVCILDENDPRHTDAETYFAAAAELVTHSYVLAELVAVCQARKLNRSAALAFAFTLLEHKDIEVVWVEELLHRSALHFLQARPDKTYSLCDAVSFLLMEEYRLRDALTTDHHFEQAGFRALLRHGS